jgi:Protein of unknown function (DUF732)
MRTLVVLAGLVVVISTAATAQADPPGGNPGSDATFLTALSNAGIPFQSGSVAVGVGRKACELMDQGHPQAEVIKSVSASNPGLAMNNATEFTTIAVSNFCPQHAGEPTTLPPPAPAQQPLIEFPIITPPAG